MDEFEITLAAVELRHKTDGSYYTLTASQSEIQTYLRTSPIIAVLIDVTVQRAVKNRAKLAGRNCRITIIERSDNVGEPSGAATAEG